MRTISLSAGNGPAINVAVWMERCGHAPMFGSHPPQPPARQPETGSCGYVGVLLEDVHAPCAVGRHEPVIRYSDVMGDLHERRHPTNVEKTVPQGKHFGQRQRQHAADLVGPNQRQPVPPLRPAPRPPYGQRGTRTSGTKARPRTSAPDARRSALPNRRGNGQLPVRAAAKSV